MRPSQRGQVNIRIPLMSICREIGPRASSLAAKSLNQARMLAVIRTCCQSWMRRGRPSRARTLLSTTRAMRQVIHSKVSRASHPRAWARSMSNKWNRRMGSPLRSLAQVGLEHQSRSLHKESLRRECDWTTWASKGRPCPRVRDLAIWSQITSKMQRPPAIWKALTHRKHHRREASFKKTGRRLAWHKHQRGPNQASSRTSTKTVLVAQPQNSWANLNLTNIEIILSIHRTPMQKAFTPIIRRIQVYNSRKEHHNWRARIWRRSLTTLLEQMLLRCPIGLSTVSIAREAQRVSGAASAREASRVSILEAKRTDLQSFTSHRITKGKEERGRSRAKHSVTGPWLSRNLNNLTSKWIRASSTSRLKCRNWRLRIIWQDLRVWDSSISKIIQPLKMRLFGCLTH